MAKSSGGRTFFLMLLVAVGVGLFIRFKCRKDKTADKPPPAAVVAVPVTADAAVAVEPPVIDARQIEEQPEAPAKPAYTGPDLFIGALSADRSRALLTTLEGYRGAWRMRVVKIDDGSVETDVELPALEDIDMPANEAVVSDLVRARAVLRGFPLGSSDFGLVATTSDGARGAFNAGDLMYLVDGDKVGAKIPLPAAYSPKIGSDGTLWMRGYDGKIDDEGKYSLFTMPVTGGKPKKVPGTDGFSGGWRVTKANTVRITVSQVPAIPSCVLEVSMTKPYRVLSKVCPEHVRDGTFSLSPNGDYVAWATDDGEVIHHVKAMEIATQKITLDAEADGFFKINDDGRVVFVTLHDDVTVWEPKLQSFRESTAKLDALCEWRNTNEMVCVDDGTVRVVAP